MKYNKTRYIEPFTIDIPSVPYRSVPYQKKDKEGSARQASQKPTDDGQDVKSTKKKAAAKRQALDEFTITDELRQWARTEFSDEIPDDVLTEFKDYWRKEPDRKLRLDWGATFKNNIRKLVGWKFLKPVVAAPTPVKFTGHKKVVL